MILNRRDAMLWAAGAALSGMALPRAASAAAPRGFDPGDPSDNLHGLAKVMGDLIGEPNWMIGEGRIYALVHGEMPVPLFGVSGLRYVKFVREGDGFRMSVRDWGFFTDLDTGAVLESYRNPYTGETNTPAPLLTRLSSWIMGPGGQHMEGYTGEAWLMDRPLLLPWSFSGEDAAVTLELLVKYGHGGYGAEWINMLARTSDVVDADVTSADMRYSWGGYSPWARWMNMGDRPGRTFWNSTGRKTASLDYLAPEVRSVYDRYFPGSLENPETYEKTSGLTTTSDEE